MEKRTTAKALYAAGGAAVLGLALVMAAMFALLALPVGDVQADGPDAQADKSAHVVVVFSGERAAVRDVSWTGAISRVAALKAAGFAVEHLDDAVCSIDGDGCPASNCWACGTNNWWQGQWDANAKDWDSSAWPPANLVDGDVIGFHNGTAWVQPALPAPSYVGGWKAVEWLRPRQVTDTGSYGNVGSTVETIFAVTANRWDAGQWRRQADSPSMLHHIYGSGDSYVTGGGQAGKMAVGLAAAGGCWPVNGTKVTAYYDPVTGQYAPQAVDQAWAMLGLKAMNQTIPASATQALKDMMTANGGWGWPGFGDDTDTTAVAVEALVAAGESVITSSHVVSGMTYIKTHQNSDGGFNSGWTTDTSNASTAAAVRAILAVGESPIAGRWVVTPSNPISYLVNAQQADGSFLYGGSANEIETRQAAVAMLGAWFPVHTAAVNDCYGLSGQVYAGAVPLGSVAVSGSDPLTDVTVTAEGWNNAGIQSTNDATGAYTLSVPTTGDYTVTPAKAGYVFSPTSRTVSVSGSPGDVTQVGDFAGEVHHQGYLPVLMRND